VFSVQQGKILKLLKYTTTKTGNKNNFEHPGFPREELNPGKHKIGLAKFRGPMGFWKKELSKSFGLNKPFLESHWAAN